ncbi:MAG: sugar phosphate isomerase/epimerase family protein, partial [Thermodesulfobacteriota bacterium]|nr:sugar phosphate isomerase/epimerase family protein [Thermodesulfobacteriota bacterium]
MEEVEEIAKLGLDFAEISFTDPHAVLQQIPTLVALRNQYDLFYLAHLPNEGNPQDIDGLRNHFSPRIKSLLDLAGTLDIGLMTFHFWLDRRFIEHKIVEEKIEMIKEMVNHAQEKQVTLCLENLSEDHHDLARTFTAIENLGMTLDIGHGQLLREENTSCTIIEKFFHRIRHIHIHDNRGGYSHKDDIHLPLGEGIIDFAPIMKALLQSGYKNTICLEVNTA